MARNELKSSQNLTKHIRITLCMHHSSIPPQNVQKNRKWENSIFERYIALHTALHIALQRAILQHSVQVKIRIFKKWPGMSSNRPRTSPNTSGSRCACITYRYRPKTFKQIENGNYCKRSVNKSKPYTRNLIFRCPAGRPPKMQRFCNAPM